MAGFTRESWPFLDLSYAERAHYNQMYKTWNPTGFDADEWTSLFAESGLRMFAFTTKHHEGFSMFDTRTRVKQRVRWDAPGGPALEDCDLAYSMMETPFRRDVVKELCEAGHKRGLRISLYFSHPDWYDADFRPYADDPVQVPSPQNSTRNGSPRSQVRRGRSGWRPILRRQQVARMMARHRAQLEELLTNYGEIDMLSLDQWLGPKVWPQMRETILQLRKLQPNVMLRARGIGNYGDYYTPEGFVPGSKSNTDVPWMVIYPLAKGFSYDPEAAHYKGAGWMVRTSLIRRQRVAAFRLGLGPTLPAGSTLQRLTTQTGRRMASHLRGGHLCDPRAQRESFGGKANPFVLREPKTNARFIVLPCNGRVGHLRFSSLRPAAGSRIMMFGYPDPMKWKYDSAAGLKIELPESLQTESRRPTEYAWGWTIQTV